jgi:putative membrane protein
MIDWGSWRNEPILVSGLVVLGWFYALCAGPLRSLLAPGERFPGKRAVSFYSGLAVLFVALGSPLDWVGRYFLLTAHTAQQLLLIFAAPVLILAGLPAWMVDPILAGARRRRVLGLLFHPVVCCALFILILSASYLPRLFEPGLRNDLVHQAQQALSLGVALLFWWQLVNPSRVYPPLGFGPQMLYLLAAEVAMTGVFTYILMAEHSMYPTYEHAPRLFAGLPATEDQTLAGVLLSAVSSLVLVGALGVNFYRWAHADENRPEARPKAG